MLDKHSSFPPCCQPEQTCSAQPTVCKLPLPRLPPALCTFLPGIFWGGWEVACKAAVHPTPSALPWSTSDAQAWEDGGPSHLVGNDREETQVLPLTQRGLLGTVLQRQAAWGHQAPRTQQADGACSHRLQ